MNTDKANISGLAAENDRRTLWIGKSFIIIGILHSIAGLVAFRDILREMFGERLFSTVTLNGDPAREAAFWFLFTGCTLTVIGALVDWIESRNTGMPPFLAWSFTAITAVGIFMMPVSGFWLLLFPTTGLFRRARK